MSGLILHSPVLAVIFYIIAVIASLLPVGAYYVIGAGSAREEQITTKEAYGRAVAKLLPFIGLGIISIILVSISLLLLVVPGIIVIGRIALSPMIMFEENLGPIKAIKRSFRLTKGRVNEMLGALFAAVLFGGGGYSLLFGALSVAPLVGRYHDLRQLEETGSPKPPTHWLNYTYLISLLIGVIIFVSLILTTYYGIKSKANNTYNGANSSTYSPYNSSPGTNLNNQ